MRVLAVCVVLACFLAGCTWLSEPTPRQVPLAREDVPRWSVGDAWHYVVITPNGTGSEERTVTGYERVGNAWAYAVKVALRDPATNVSSERRIRVEESTLDQLNADGSRIAEMHFPIEDGATWDVATGGVFTTRHHASFQANASLPKAVGASSGALWRVDARLVQCAGKTCDARGANVSTFYAPAARNAVARVVTDERGVVAYRATLDSMRLRCGAFVDANGTASIAELEHPGWSSYCASQDRFNATKEADSKMAAASAGVLRGLSPSFDRRVIAWTFGVATGRMNGPARVFVPQSVEIAALQTVDPDARPGDAAPWITLQVRSREDVAKIAAMPFVYEIDLTPASPSPI